MESKIHLHKICCPTHPDDIVIRVDLNPKQEKLFYCHECLADYKGPEMTKFQDILKVLESQYNNNSLEGAQVALPQEIKGLSSMREDMQNDLSDQIAEEKQKVFEEAKKIEIQMAETFNMVKTAIHAHFDIFKENFNKSFDEYEQSVTFLKQIGGQTYREQSKQESIHKKIFTSSDTKEVENNLRKMLTEINMYREVNNNQGIDKIIAKKAILEQALKAPALIESKGLNYYAEKLRIYQSYLEAVLVCFKKDRQNENARDKDKDFQFEKGCEELASVLTNLNKQMESSNKEIEQILGRKFTLDTKKRTCTVSEKGRKNVLGKAYSCRTCQNKYRDIREYDYVCESCKDICHSGHNLELAGELEFVCQCQFKMMVCQLAVCCTFRFTGKTFINQVKLICGVDPMEYNTLLCSYCANNCHQGHPMTRQAIGSAFCDCPILFPFCKFLTENQNQVKFE